MSEQSKKPTDAEEIFSEFKKIEKNTKIEEHSRRPSVENAFESEHKINNFEKNHAIRNVIFIGTKPIMTYVTATLTQLSNQSTVTIKARGKRISQAVDVSQMITKRMNTVGYKISNVMVSSDLLTSNDGKQRNVSAIEIDITK